ncbi:MAG: hypothetical protein DSY46_03615 [Hydrogenimonas sp.]|nr:MAG: hypothetical protein DSY46_03615 [Hydrogenimonas sp.]
MNEKKTHNGISQADIYQLYAYGTKYQACTKLFLIYPKDQFESDDYYEFFEKEDEKKLRLQILFFDLDNPEKFVEAFENAIALG